MDHPDHLRGDDGGNKCRDEPWRQSHHPRELGMGYRPFSDSLLLQDLPLVDSSSNLGNFVSSNSKTPMSDLGMSITGNNHFTNGSNRSASSDWSHEDYMHQQMQANTSAPPPPPQQQQLQRGVGARSQSHIQQQDIYQQQQQMHRMQQMQHQMQRQQQQQMALLQMRSDVDGGGRQRRSRRVRNQQSNRNGHIPVSIPEMSAYSSDSSGPGAVGSSHTKSSATASGEGATATARTAVHPYARGRMIGVNNLSLGERRQPFRAQSDSVLLDVRNLEESSLIDIVCQAAKKVLLENRKQKLDSEYRGSGSSNSDCIPEEPISLKAVELANSLRSKLGVHLLAHVRDVFGGLLNLLERRPDTFDVVRIPKNDHVVLVQNQGEPHRANEDSSSPSTSENGGGGVTEEHLLSAPPGLHQRKGPPVHFSQDGTSPMNSNHGHDVFPSPSRGGLEQLLLQPPPPSSSEGSSQFDSMLFQGLLSNLDEKHPATFP